MGLPTIVGICCVIIVEQTFLIHLARFTAERISESGNERRSGDD